MMSRSLALPLSLTVLATACRCPGPDPWTGPVLTAPRSWLTVDDLRGTDPLELVDMSFYARPAWAAASDVAFSGTVTFSEAELLAPKDRASYAGEDLFPELSIELVRHGEELVPRVDGVIDTRAVSDSYWDVFVGTGAVWQEQGDLGWSRASLPIQLMGRYVGEVRNCVVTFAFTMDEVSNTHLQCSQETAVLDAGQLGDIRAVLPTTWEPHALDNVEALLRERDETVARRIPTAPLSTVDVDDAIAEHFCCAKATSASTSLGAVSMDGVLYVDTARTRHGVYPYPDEMRHGVFSVTKSMAGALAMFYFAERYGEELFDEPIADHVPALAHLPEWQGVSFGHALNMVTGTRAGEDLLYEQLELAPDKEAAIGNIAQLGDYPEAPGEVFNYATTNTFVLSYALEEYVQAREGAGVHYWDLVRDEVLVPIGAEDFHLLQTRDEDPSERIPILGLGAAPNLDSAAKIAALIANEGAFEGQQLLHRDKVREALGRTEWEGYEAFSGLRYRHSFWSDEVRAGGCTVQLSYMEGLGDNRIVFFPSGAVSFQFTDEFDDHLRRLARAVEGVRSSCD